MLKRVAGTPSGVFRRRTTRAGRRNANSTIPKGKTMKAIKFFAAPLAALSLAVSASAQSVYELNSSVGNSTTIDLTSMNGYYADRMYGPSSVGITFGGMFKYDSSVSVSNPFQLIGRGNSISINNLPSEAKNNANPASFMRVPLKFFNAEGVNATSWLYVNKGYVSCDSLYIGRGAAVRIAYNAGWGGGNGATAIKTLFLHDGGQLTTEDNVFMALGANVSPFSGSVIDRAALTGVQGLRLGYQSDPLDFPLSMFLGVTNATVSAGGTDLDNGRAFTMLFQAENASDTAEVVLGSNGWLRANCIQHFGAGSSRICFDGGSYVPYTSGESASLPLFYARGRGRTSNAIFEPKMTVVGINGNPIDVSNAVDRALCGGSTGNREINITGDGGFTKRGAGTLRFNRLTQHSACDYTGPTAILGGGVLVTDSEFKPGRGLLTVAEGAFLDLNGFDAEFSDASGSGLVSNRAETVSTLTLGLGDGDGTLSVEIGERVNVVKTGTGTLTVSGAALAATCDLTVEAGKVVFAGHSSSYGIVRVKSGATLDTTGTNFSCSRIIREPGGTVLPPAATVMCIR